MVKSIKNMKLDFKHAIANNYTLSIQGMDLSLRLG